MSRFNSAAYDKLFPRIEDPVPVQETAVETFTPSQDKLEGKDPDVKEDTIKAQDFEIPEDPDPEVGGVEDGYAEHSKPDSE